MGLKADVVSAAKRQTQDKSELIRIKRWSQACYDYAWLLPFFDLALVNWMNYSWSETNPPELLDVVAKWTEMAELEVLVGMPTPIKIPPAREEDYAEAGMYSIEFLERSVRRFSAYMEVAEERRPDDYQEVLKQQLDALLAKFREAVELDAEILSESDEVLEFIYDWRDQLQYAVFGIAKLQLESNTGRLPNIDPNIYRRELDLLDQKFRKIHSAIRRAKQDAPDDRAPDSFWWRKK